MSDATSTRLPRPRSAAVYDGPELAPGVIGRPARRPVPRAAAPPPAPQVRAERHRAQDDERDQKGREAG